MKRGAATRRCRLRRRDLKAHLSEVKVAHGHSARLQRRPRRRAELPREAVQELARYALVVNK